MDTIDNYAATTLCYAEGGAVAQSVWILLIIMLRLVEHSTTLCYAEGGAVAQSVERATPGQEVPGSIPAVSARSLLVGSVSV